MLELNIVIVSPDSKRDSLEKRVAWPTVPRKNEQLDLADQGTTGFPATVTGVKHWLGGDGSVDVYCRLLDEETEEVLGWLRENGWK